MTPVWDSEQSKYVAEEEREEKETASLEDEINFMRDTNTSTNTTTNTYDTSDEDEDPGTVTNLDEDNGDDLPF